MQESTLVRNLRLTGLIVGFMIFAFTTIRWMQSYTNAQIVQHGPLMARVTNH